MQSTNSHSNNWQMPVINEDSSSSSSSSRHRRSSSNNSSSSSRNHSPADAPAVPPRSPRRQKPSQLQQLQEQRQEKLPLPYGNNNTLAPGIGNDNNNLLTRHHQHHHHSSSTSSNSINLKQQGNKTHQKQKHSGDNQIAAAAATSSSSIPYTRSPPPAYSPGNISSCPNSPSPSTTPAATATATAAAAAAGGGSAPRSSSRASSSRATGGPRRYEGPVVPLPKDNRYLNRDDNSSNNTNNNDDNLEDGEGGAESKLGGGFAGIGGLRPRRSRRCPSWFTSRGGWGRVTLYFATAVICVLGLVLGLVFGLRARDNRRGTNPNQQPSSSPSSPSFPAGSYAFETHLTTVDTSCSTSAAAWRCYPYTTYSSSDKNDSSSSSAATFYWVISEFTTTTSDDDDTIDSRQYTISSSPNLFAPQFESLPLKLSSSSSSFEILEFEFIIGDSSSGSKNNNFTVYPVEPLIPPSGSDAGDGEGTTECRYPGTRMKGRIWTNNGTSSPTEGDEMTTSRSANGVKRTEGSSNFEPWPHRVEVTEVVDGSEAKAIPDCVKVRDGEESAIGKFSVEGGECSCGYSNFGL